ncbi:hypothetical protein I600_1758 [Maribacter dokdonensis DSW-8]|nr:hypothetical protein I600_1758 [Maribacter dokdonensis DSW-8]
MVYGKVTELYLGTFGETLDSADSAMAELLATWVLESEVHNGGFDQFFHNNGLDYGFNAVNGLSRIKAEDYLVVTKKAIEVFKNQNDEFQKKRNPDFDSLDDDFYDLEGIEDFRIKYIRNNYAKFMVE